MAERTEEEREWLRQEREWKKEEKRRDAEQKKCEAERAARRRALRQRVDVASSLFHRGSSAALNAPDTASQNTTRGRCFVVQHICLRMTEAFAFLWRILVKAGSALAAFAGKPWSVPVFILAVVVSYIGITCGAGFRLFELTVHPPTLQFYVCDYSVGICSRLFVGAVIGLFTDRVTIQMMNTIINCAVCFSLLIQAVFAGLLLRAGLKNHSAPAALMGLLMTTDPLAVVENMSSPGLLDVYLLVLFLLWLSLLKTPLIALATPVFCLVGMAIHYEFLFSFLPPMLTLLLNYAFFAKKKRQRIGRWIAFAGGSGVSAASFFYFVFLAKDHLRMTSDEYYRHMLSRFSLTVSQRDTLTSLMGAPVYRPYFDFYIFGQYQNYDYFKNIVDFFEFLKNWTVMGFVPGMLYKDLALFLPVFLLAAVLWGKCTRGEKGLKKLPYICFIGQALVLVPELIISTDIWRWVSAALLAQFFVFAVVYLDKDAPLHRVADHTKMKPIPIMGGLAAAVAYIAYGFTLM